MLVHIPSSPGYMADLETGEIWSHRRGCLRKMSGGIDTNGYRIYTIRGDGTQKTRTGHQLVCEAAHGQKPIGYVCRHLNGVKTDNRSDNLSWGSHSENNGKDKISMGTLRFGERHQNSKLTAENVLTIRSRLGQFSLSEMAKTFGVSQSTIHKAALGKTWGHLK